MSQLPDRLGEYVGTDETLEAVYAATLVEDSSRTPVSVALTDRRLLYVSERGQFGNVEYGSIATVRSRPLTARTYCLDDYRLALAVGALVAVAGFAWAVAAASALVVPFFLLAGLSGLVTAEYMRRHAEYGGGIPLHERVAVVDPRETVRQLRGDASGTTSLYQLLLLASGLLAAACLVGAVVVTGSVAVVSGTVLFLGGLGLADHAYHNRENFEGFDVVRHRETAVYISTENGWTLRLRVDDGPGVCREVSRLAAGD